jgi:hypothetical protein
MSDFEEFMAPRLERSRGDEATQVIFELWDGRRLEDAVLDAIESLPATKTKRLRAWVSQAGDYSEWRKFEREGWEIRKKWRSAFPHAGDRFVVISPRGDRKSHITGPSYDYLAAAVGAGVVSFVGVCTTDGECIYEVIRA